MRHFVATWVPSCEEPGLCMSRPAKSREWSLPTPLNRDKSTEKGKFLCLSALLVETPHFCRLLCWIGVATYSQSYSYCRTFQCCPVFVCPSVALALTTGFWNFWSQTIFLNWPISGFINKEDPSVWLVHFFTLLVQVRTALYLTGQAVRIFWFQQQQMQQRSWNCFWR